MFHHTDFMSINKFFKENGYVVVTGVLNDIEINDTISEICNHNALLGDYDFDIKNPETWDKPYIGERGFVDINQGHSQGHIYSELNQFWKNRQNEYIVDTFKHILECDDILLDACRYNVMRPTKVNPKWKTKDKWLHWDKNPWKHPEHTTIQGLLTLTDHNEKSGGFCCIPKFHHHLQQWANENQEYKEKNNNSTNYVVEFPDNESYEIKQIHAPKGSLIIWDSGLPHCNYSNDGYEFRIAQYISFQRKHSATTSLIEKLRTTYLEAFVTGESFFKLLTPIGRKIMNFEEFQQKYPITHKDIEAFHLYIKGNQLETQKKFDESIQCYSRAEKLSDLVAIIYL